MVYIILVNWRGYADTIECLESLLRIAAPEFRVIVVDNESRDEGVAKLADWAGGRSEADRRGAPWAALPAGRVRSPTFQVLSSAARFDPATAPLVTVIRCADNLGFAAGNNVGIRAALGDPDCGWCWLLNNDTVVDPQALARLCERAQADPRIGICGSTLLYYDTPSRIQSLGGTYNRFIGRGRNLAMGRPASELPASSEIEGALDYIVGASMLVSRGFLQTVGLMNEDYFLYFEELDWSRRNAGRYRQVWARDSLVYHKEGGSIGTNSRGRMSDTALYYYNVNFLRFTRRYHNALLPFAWIYTGLKSLKMAARGDMAGAAVVLGAIADFSLRRRKTGPRLARAAGVAA